MAWYDKKLVIWLAIIIFFPIGLIMMWRTPNFGTKTKVIVTAIFALLIIGGRNHTPTNTATNTVAQPPKVEQSTQKTAPPPKQIKTYGAGQMKVGVDIPAGEYAAIGNGYLEIAANSSGALESIIMNDNVVNRRYVSIYDGEYVKIVGSLKLVAIADAPKVDTSKGQIPEGQYKVGVDIPAGEYSVQSLGEGYVEVAVNDRGSLDGIVTNANLQGKTSMYITVSQGDYFETCKSDCKIVTVNKKIKPP